MKIEWSDLDVKTQEIGKALNKMDWENCFPIEFNCLKIDDRIHVRSSKSFSYGLPEGRIYPLGHIEASGTTIEEAKEAAVNSIYSSFRSLYRVGHLWYDDPLGWGVKCE